MDERQQKIGELEALVDDRQQRTCELQTAHNELEAVVGERNQKIGELEAVVDERQQQIGALEELVGERQQQIGALEAACTEFKALGDERDHKIGALEAQTDGRDQTIGELTALQEEKEQRDQRIGKLEYQVGERDQKICALEALQSERQHKIGELEAAHAALEASILDQLASDAVGLMGKLQDDNRVAELEQTQAAMEGELEAATQQIAELEAARGELGVEVEALIAADVMNRELVHNLSSRYQDQLQTSLFEASAAREQTSAVGSPTAETDLLIQVVGQLQQQVLQHQAEATSKQEELSRAHEQIEIWEGVVSNLTSQCGSEPLRTALDDRQDVMLAESAPAIIRADEHIQRLMPYPAESSRHSRRAAFLAKHKLSASVGGEPNDSLQMPQTVKTGGDLTPFESSFSALELVRSSRISCVETCLKLMQ